MTPARAVKELMDPEGYSPEDFHEADPSPDFALGLLDPESWRSTLETYAKTVKMCVALTDMEGRLLGDCLNPQPTWELVRQVAPVREGQCPFCLDPMRPCQAVVDAIKAGAPVVTEDRAGLAHVAVPVALGGRSIAALIAGQVFGHYPEPVSLQRVAGRLGISPQKLWNQAIQERPVSRTALQTYGTLLMTMGRAFLGRRFASLLYARLAEAHTSIEQSLKEKETLLGEVQHRVKNNLQIVASLLHLQSDSLDKVKDVRAIAALKASQQREDAMARIHNFLYGNERVGDIDLGAYIKDLADMAISAFQSNNSSIHAHFSLATAVLSMRQAVPCGLIVNELVTNVFKYAYPKGVRGDLYITVHPMVEDQIALTISDHGVGMPEGLDWRSSSSLGLSIVRVLAGQLDGELELDAREGVAFTLRFHRETAATNLGPAIAVA